MENDVITMAHGAGGSLSHALVEKYILPEFGNPLLNELHDGATGVAPGDKRTLGADVFALINARSA